MSLVYLSGCLSVARTCPPPSRKHDFWIAQAILSNFCFQKKKIFFLFKIFFHSKFFLSKIFFTSTKIFPLSLFYTFLDVSCHPDCLKRFLPQMFFHPKFFWVKQGATQCYQAFWVFFFLAEQWEFLHSLTISVQRLHFCCSLIWGGRQSCFCQDVHFSSHRTDGPRESVSGQGTYM